MRDLPSNYALTMDTGSLQDQVASKLCQRHVQQALNLLQCSLPAAQQDMQSALLLACQLLSLEWISKEWAHWIAEGETPIQMSSRDGKLLKLIPPTQRLLQSEVEQHLLKCLHRYLKAESQKLLCHAWLQGRNPGKAALAFMRSQAYLAAGRPDIALKDVHLAMSYGPQHGHGSSWAWAWATQSAAQEALHDNTAAALSIQHAIELQPECQYFQQSLERLLNRIPEAEAECLQASGSKGLQTYLDNQAQQAKPEFMRKRPKYYYYYQWMRERLHRHCGQLPAPVEDKLLTLDATELDMLLTHPKGIQQQAQKLINVLDTNGPGFLATYRLPRLTWKEATALKKDSPAEIEADPGEKQRASADLLAAAQHKEDQIEAAKHSIIEEDLDALELECT